MTPTLKARSRRRLSVIYGLLGATGAFSFLVLLIVLHRLRPDLSPVGSFVSDYANGPYGSLFRSALVFHGLGNFVTAVGLASVFVTSRSGRSGAILFGIAAVGTILGGFFSIDAFSAPRTMAGTIHKIVASVSFPVEAVALIFFSQALGALTGSRSFSLITFAAAAGGITALAWLLASLVTGSFPGLAERAAFAVFLIWEISAAIFLIRNSSMVTVIQST